MKTFCPECGPAVEVDEDGCCETCGNGATGRAVAFIELKRVASDLRRRIRLARACLLATPNPFDDPLEDAAVLLDLRRPLKRAPRGKR